MPAVNDTVLGSIERLAAVDRARRVLPSLPMPLDGVARLAATLLDAPTGVVSLTRDDDDYLVGAHHLPVPLDTDRRLPTRYSLCQYMISDDTPLECPDLRADRGLRDHPVTVELGFQAVVGTPLHDATGETVGTLTVLDTRPRTWRAEHLTTLRRVAALLEPIPVDEVFVGTAAIQDLDAPSVLDGLLEAFVGFTSAGVVVGWNHAAAEMLGWTAEEAIGRHLDVLGPPEYAGMNAEQMLPQVLADPAGWRAPRRMVLRHRDGHRFPAQVRLSVVRGRAGALVCAFLTDETEVVRGRSFADVLLDSLDSGVSALDAEGHVVLANRAVREMFGQPVDWTPEMGEAAMQAAVHFHPDGRPMSLAETPLWRALAGQPSRGAEILTQVGDGPLRYLDVTAQQIRDGDGTVHGAVAVFQEITERRRAERIRDCEFEVARALARTRTVAEAGQQIATAVGTSLNWPYVQLWLVDQVSGALELIGDHRAPGLDVDDLIPSLAPKGWGFGGKAWETGTPLWIPDLTTVPDTTPEFGERSRALAERGLRTVLAVPIRNVDEVLGVLVGFADSAHYDETTLIAHLEGITGQIGQAMAHRRAAELALELARTKDDFIALVGHEMRTPLTSIATYTELLAGAADTWPATDRQLLEVIGRNTTALRAIIEDLLDLTALESGHLRIVPQRVDLAALVTAAAESAAPAAERTGVRVRTRVPDQLVVDGDPDRLRQVVDNLLSNAIKYSPDGGDVRLCLTTRERVAELTVTDSGIGIPEAERHQLFRRFYRASTARDRGIPGTGLGLSIVRALVEAHGGQIRLTDRSDPAVEEPTSETPEARTPEAGKTEDGGPGITVVVRLPLPAA